MSETASSQAQTEVNRLLQQGIAAVKAGERQQARDLLLRVVEQDEKNVAGWLWLSAVVDSLEDQETCLANVLAVDPHNQAATKGLGTIRQKLVDDYMRRGVAAAKSGQRAQARELFDHVLTRDENNVQAWIWLGNVVETEEERETCLRKAQALDPNNESVRNALTALQQRRQAAQEARAAEERARAPMPRQAAAPPAMPKPAPAPVVEQESKASPDLPDDAFDLTDEYLCPYCAASTQPEDRRCKSCGGSLWIQVPRLSGMSTALWGTFGIQFLNSLNYLALPLWTLINLVIQIKALTFMSGIGEAIEGGKISNPFQSLLSFQNPMDLIPLYLGLPHEVSPEIADMAFELLPRNSFILLILPIVLAIPTLVALFIRVKPAYYFIIATAVFDVLFVLACFMISPLKEVVPTPFRGIATVLVLVRGALIFSIEDDFFADDQRILLRPDRGVSDGTHFLQRGLHYARQKMWALAALHLREATQLLPDQVDGHVSLMLSYVKLGRPALAAQVLKVVEQNRPDDPRIAELGVAIREELEGGAAPA
jgi:tetratricopeptide (TPR) repeat protein